MQFVKNYLVGSGIEIASFRGGSCITIPDPVFPEKRIPLAFPIGCLLVVENFPLLHKVGRKTAHEWTTAHYNKKASIRQGLGDVMEDIKNNSTCKVTCCICYGEIPRHGKRVLQVRSIVFQIVEKN